MFFLYKTVFLKLPSRLFLPENWIIRRSEIALKREMVLYKTEGALSKLSNTYDKILHKKVPSQKIHLCFCGEQTDFFHHVSSPKNLSGTQTFFNCLTCHHVPSINLQFAVCLAESDVSEVLT